MTFNTKRKKAQENLIANFGKLKDNDFNFELIEQYFRNKNHRDAFQVLSDKTCNDLDFEELFMFLDRTTSKIGQQYLYDKLRTISLTDDQIAQNEDIIKVLTDNVEFRIKTQKLLQKLTRDDVFYISSLFQEEHTQPPKWFFVIRILSFTSFLSLVMMPVNPKLFLLLIAVFIINIGIHYWNKKNLYKYLGSIPQLLRLNNIASKLFKEKLYKDINPDLPESIKIIEQVRNRMSFFQLEAKLQSDFEALFWAMLELVKTLFLLEPLLLFGVLKRLDTKRKEIEDVYQFVGHIDMLISIASLRKGLENYCIPTIGNDSADITVKQIFHPLIADCVPNNIQTSNKSVLLTGSNMSGKTSFIRTIGINIISGLTINTCFAESMTFPRLRVYSAIRISDDLLNDKSYYFEEVLTIKAMIEKSKDETSNLFLLDEIYKGTNTIERISAGKAVLAYLAQKNNFVFVSTHDIELTELLNDTYDLYHFSEIVNNNNVDFDYLLKEGKLKNRNAIRILEINGYPGEVTGEANKTAAMLDVVALGNGKLRNDKDGFLKDT